MQTSGCRRCCSSSSLLALSRRCTSRRPVTARCSHYERNGRVHLVDYKSTSQKSPDKKITLDDWWKASYKRQMDLYVWVMRRLGLDTSDIGYFLYCDGDRFTDTQFLHQDHATMRFKMTLLPYKTDVSWVEPTLMKIKQLLDSGVCPDHAENCEYGEFLSACNRAAAFGQETAAC